LKVLGIHDGHGASAALIESGRIIAAVQEERLARVKNRGGFPEFAIEEVLRIGSAKLEEVDFFCFAGNKENDSGQRMSHLIEKGVGRDKILFFDHHLCHCATAYFGQPQINEPILILTCDACGDDICATVSIGQNGEIKNIAKIGQENSAAIIYSIITMLLGFKPFEEEYKIMGLAPYNYDCQASERICDSLMGLFEFCEGKPFVWQRVAEWPADLAGYIKTIINGLQSDEVAAGVQKFVERFFVRWVKNCIDAVGIKKIALSGGLFMNVKLNKIIMELPQVETLYVFPSCGDETNSIGAAWLGHKQACETIGIEPLGDFYLGGDFDSSVKDVLDNYKFIKNVKITKCDDIEKKVAQLLADGQIVARCKGRAEFGARALGNRSILSDASNRAAVGEINSMIKMRDLWMPFAPSMMDIDADEYFENPKNIFSPYMILAFDSKAGQAEKLAAALHQADLTCRPGVVRKEYNDCFYKLLEYYKKLTGSSAVLNTSFNLHGFPMVYMPVDALDVFDKSGLKYLALGDYLIEQG
jgi:carbamoyltransferase